MTEKQARELLRIRKEKFETDAKAAKHFKISKATLSGVLAGDRSVSAALAKKLGLTLTIRKVRVYEEAR